MRRSKREGGQKEEGTGEHEAPSPVWASCLTGPEEVYRGQALGVNWAFR